MELRWKCFDDHTYTVTYEPKNLLVKLIHGSTTMKHKVVHKPILQYKVNNEWIDVPTEQFPFPDPEEFPDKTHIC